MKSYNLFFVLLLSLIWIMTSCKNNKHTNNETSIPKETIEITKETSPPPSHPKLDRLDNLDLTTMKKIHTKNSEEGDCSSHITHYEVKGNVLIIDSVDCYDYGQHYYHYLLNKSEEIQLVHVKSITPTYDDESSQYFYEISEHIVDFYNSNAPKMKSITEKISQDTPETKVKFDENFDESNPWIIVNEKGDDFLFGKKINYEGDWQKAITNALKNRLMDIDILPSRLPMTMNGTVGMGHRSTMRDLFQDAIKEVVSVKEYELRQSFDHFSRLTKPLENVSVPEDYLKIAYWKKMITNL